MFCKLRKLCTYLILHMFFNAYIYIYMSMIIMFIVIYIYIDEIYANISAFIHIYIGRLYIYL